MPTSSYETLTRDFLRALFPRVVWQERVRPDWLRNPATGNRMEIDFLQPQSKVGIEVQGPGHFRSVAGMTDAQHSQSQQDRDTAKRHQCAEQGIQLIPVSIADLRDDHRLWNLYVTLRRLLPSQGFPLTYSQFASRFDVAQVVRQANRKAARPVRPWKDKPTKKPGLLGRILGLFR